MKRVSYIFLMILISALMLANCNKKPELKVYHLEIVEEKVEASTESVVIKDTYYYPSKLEYVNAYLSRNENMSAATMKKAEIIEDIFIARFDELLNNTKYYYRFEYNNGINLVTTDTKSFTTVGYSLPGVTTSEITDITANSAVCGGEVTSAGNGIVSARGVCWGKSHNPSLFNNVIVCGDSLGAFSTSITNLEDNTLYYVRAYATNEKGTAYGEEKSFNTSGLVPTVLTISISSITYNSASSGGIITSDGGFDVTAKGVCWSKSQNPTLSDSHTNEGPNNGLFVSNMTNLDANTMYYVKAYATNINGTGYGSEMVFLTDPTNCVVITKQVTNITDTTARCGGNVTYDGGLEILSRGVCWSTQHNPTINDAHTIDGEGLGEFDSEITGLNPNATYYIRAYATTDFGTTYGDEIEFHTIIGLPFVTTKPVLAIRPTTATCGGEVTYDGGSDIIKKGVCWNTSPNPTILNYNTNNGIYTGAFTAYMKSLTPNTTYYVRAYAQNSSETVYGEEYSFTTPQATQSPQGTINGKFSVSGIKRVYFSKGNLQYSAASQTWHFAAKQTDYIGDNNVNISPTYNNYIDLFGWGTSGNDHGAVCYMPYSTSTSSTDYYAYGNANYDLNDQNGTADWGSNTIDNIVNINNNWRTLEQSEWSYLLTTRNTNSGILFVKANVLNKNGILLLPDDWDADIYAFNEINSGTASYTSNTITYNDFVNILEINGAVFLPAAGGRNKTNLSQVGASGYYWTTTHNASKAYNVYFTNTSLNKSGVNQRYLGFSVRLVTDE